MAESFSETQPSEGFSATCGEINLKFRSEKDVIIGWIEITDVENPSGGYLISVKRRSPNVSTFEIQRSNDQEMERLVHKRIN